MEVIYNDHLDIKLAAQIIGKLIYHQCSIYPIAILIMMKTLSMRKVKKVIRPRKVTINNYTFLSSMCKKMREDLLRSFEQEGNDHLPSSGSSDCSIYLCRFTSRTSFHKYLVCQKKKWTKT